MRNRAALYKQMAILDRAAARNGHQLGDFIAHPGGPLRVDGMGFDHASAAFKIATCLCGAQAYVHESEKKRGDVAGWGMGEVSHPCTRDKLQTEGR